jgi:hypothetical protein
LEVCVSVAPVVELPHPLVGGVERIEAALDLMPVEAWGGLEPEVVRSLVERLMRIEARVRGQLVAGTRVLDASGVAKKAGATSTGAMLAKSFGGDRRAADAMVHQGKAMEKAPATETALAEGQIGSAQAAIIAGAVKDLPDGVRPEDRQACEDTLIGDAGRLTLKDLRSRAMRITDQFKPDAEVDETENDTLAKREANAWKRSEFWMIDDGDGTCRGGFRLPEAQADMLKTAIHAICAPKRDHLRDHPGATDTTGTESESVYDRDLDFRTRLGMGCAELCSHLPADRLPANGGLGATLMVRLDLDTLRKGIRAATLSTGTRVSAAQARLMACNLGIIPQVFGGSSVPLDHGHERRLFTRHQKQALAARDGGCTFPGCDRPPEQSEAHHWRQAWANGATTTLDDGVLVCPHHHRVIHNDKWALRQGPDGHIEYRSPGALLWQRNHRWRP